jgi:hypothetical protein
VEQFHHPIQGNFTNEEIGKRPKGYLKYEPTTAVLEPFKAMPGSFDPIDTPVPIDS